MLFYTNYVINEIQITASGHHQKPKRQSTSCFQLQKESWLHTLLLMHAKSFLTTAPSDLHQQLQSQ